MVPHPVYALLLLFPVTSALDAAAEEGLLRPAQRASHYAPHFEKSV